MTANQETDVSTNHGNMGNMGNMGKLGDIFTQPTFTHKNVPSTIEQRMADEMDAEIKKQLQDHIPVVTNCVRDFIAEMKKLTAKETLTDEDAQRVFFLANTIYEDAMTCQLNAVATVGKCLCMFLRKTGREKINQIGYLNMMSMVMNKAQKMDASEDKSHIDAFIAKVIESAQPSL